MKTTKTVIFILALALGSASADFLKGRSSDRREDERPKTGLKDGVKNLAKGLWGGIRYQKAAIEDTLRDVKGDIRRTVRGEEPLPDESERVYEQPRPRQEARSGPYRNDTVAPRNEEGGDFIHPEPLWKNHERELEKRRRHETEGGYGYRGGDETLPPPRELPEYDPRLQPSQPDLDKIYGPQGPAVRDGAAPTTLPKPQDRKELPDSEKAEVTPLPPSKENVARTKAPEPKITMNEPRVQSKTVQPPKTPATKSAPKASDFKKATKTDKPGIVLSPYPPYDLLDITGLKSGSLAKDPKTGQIFRVP